MQEKIVVSWEFLHAAPEANGSEIIEWMATASRLRDGSYLVRLIAKLAPGFALVSQKTDPVRGWLPTRLSFNEHQVLQLEDSCSEIGQLTAAMDDGWVVYPDKSGRISYMQKVKLRTGLVPEICGSVDYQLCSEREVLEPQRVHFNIRLVKYTSNLKRIFLMSVRD